MCAQATPGTVLATESRTRLIEEPEAAPGSPRRLHASAGRNVHQFVFIGGLHRSGTTLLHDCLADHPSISGLTNTGVPMNEGQFLQSVFPPWGTRRKLWPLRYLKPVAPDFLTSRGYGGPGRFGFDTGSMLDETSPLVTAENARSIRAAWEPYWDMTRPLLAEKSPPNLVRMRFLQALFPRSYFIVLMRHPVPVSYATRRWTKVRPMSSLFEHWVRCYGRFLEDRSQLERVFCLRYEDFVAAPQQALDRIFDFLGVERVELERTVAADVNARYFQRWNDTIRSSRIRAGYARLLQRRYEASFNRFGYTLGTPLLEAPDAGLADSGPAGLYDMTADLVDRGAEPAFTPSG
jgi:hypothetical protein